MFVKKECVAMLLAGGQGSRLHVLTEKVAKPAVPFGGKYRIIDFPLSNCVNSGIDTVGVLTQYQPLILNDYIGNGQPWGLDRVYGGVHILPPYQSVSGASWYAGTANAIYQNISFIERYDPEYVLILSGDHIYKMNYDNMLKVHKQRQADCTIAVLEVEMQEASRFGIMNTDENGDVYEFEEKPEHPKSNLASMGIYIFNWDVLKQYLIADENDPNSSKDFGKNIIPNMLNDQKKLTTYHFDGYWKDVGTIDSLWEANMDLINPNVPMDLYDPGWKIYSRNPVAPPHYVSRSAVVQNSMVTEGCKVYGKVDFSILFASVTIEEGAIIRDSIIMPGAHIKSGAVVDYAIVGENAVVGENAHIGARPEASIDSESWGVAVVGPNLTISDGSIIPAKAMIDKNM
ncbi:MULTISPECIES: glucose-1-phosphate adenylyltransferase [Clostridiaceae]|uniref:Glucose-1-phosphate adenylyltransferase n=1 Tax=Clostridium facile TaxID=2763035 RepID=A0ABR7IRC0_9CLOT|nr:MULTISPECIES: glucose-1-phosphate adenylyltransferase [Clostridiaceae]MBC5787672.1 glucose-1-phosphate adenylyltransferase [Clostridium facile]PWN00496.1 MAG: glucose-1-phosphate adenylyltransferase [Massilioclostridium sp.]